MWRCGFCFLQHPRLTLLSFLFRIRTLWSGRHESKGSQEFTLSLSFEMLKPVRCAGLKLGGRSSLMDHRLRLVFGHVPQNIRLYFFPTKPDICVRLTYKEVHSFIIWAHPEWQWLIAAFLSLLWRMLIEKNDLEGSEYGYFMTVKCLQYEVDCYEKVRANRSLWVNFCPSCHCIAAHLSPLQSALFLWLLHGKVILGSCHWRAVLPSHKSIILDVSVAWT